MTDLEMNNRYHYWAGHGHEGIYGDDGEMQCVECGVDYKRDPLAIVMGAATKAKMEWKSKIELKARQEALEEVVAMLMRLRYPYPGLTVQGLLEHVIERVRQLNRI